MTCELTSTVEPAAAARSPFASQRYSERAISERLATFGIIGAMHLVAILAIWTRHVLIEPQPAPLIVSAMDSVLPKPPPAPPVIVPTLSVAPVVLAPPLPPTIEIPDEAPTAITAKELPMDQPTAPAVVSSNSTAARFDADYLNNPKPVYPPLSRRLREEGIVVLKVLVRADGSVAEASIDKHSGSQRLDQAALNTVKQWHFVPARRGSEAIESSVLVPIEFELQS